MKKQKIGKRANVDWPGVYLYYRRVRKKKKIIKKMTF